MDGSTADGRVASSAWQPTASWPWHIGKSIGDLYTVTGHIGSGGMGCVFLGNDCRSGGPVAIKVPFRDFANNPHARHCIVREVEHWMRLRHPNIVRVFDYKDGHSTGQLPTIIMEYCPGRTLYGQLYGGGRQLRFDEKLDILIQVSWAMDHAHRQGMIHRDLKPQNVLLSEENEVHVTDFGLVKALGAEDAPELPFPGRLINLEVSGMCGTPPYMPPEQWTGHACEASDIYSAGIMMYELFCGRLPFQAHDLQGYHRAHTSLTPSWPRKWSHDLPSELESLIMGCLEKSDRNRPRDFASMAEAMADVYKQFVGRAHSNVGPKPSFEKLSSDQHLGLARATLRLGLGCYGRGDFHDAFRQFRLARKAFQAAADPAGAAACLRMQALALHEDRHPAQAMELLQQHQQLSNASVGPVGRALAAGHQAIILAEQGELPKAMELCAREEALLRDVDLSVAKQVNLATKAAILGLQMRFPEALDALGRQAELCRHTEHAYGRQANAGLKAWMSWQTDKLDEALAAVAQQEDICRGWGYIDALQISNRLRAGIDSRSAPCSQTVKWHSELLAMTRKFRYQADREHVALQFADDGRQLPRSVNGQVMHILKALAAENTGGLRLAIDSMTNSRFEVLVAITRDLSDEVLGEFKLWLSNRPEGSVSSAATALGALLACEEMPFSDNTLATSLLLVDIVSNIIGTKTSVVKSSLFALTTVLKAFGMGYQTVKICPAEVLNDRHTPMVVHLKREHYLTILSVGQASVDCSDDGCFVTVSRDELEAQLTGFIMTRSDLSHIEHCGQVQDEAQAYVWG